MNDKSADLINKNMLEQYFDAQHKITALKMIEWIRSEGPNQHEIKFIINRLDPDNTWLEQLMEQMKAETNQFFKSCVIAIKDVVDVEQRDLSTSANKITDQKEYPEAFLNAVKVTTKPENTNKGPAYYLNGKKIHLYGAEGENIVSHNMDSWPSSEQLQQLQERICKALNENVGIEESDSAKAYRMALYRAALDKIDKKNVAFQEHAQNWLKHGEVKQLPQPIHNAGDYVIGVKGSSGEQVGLISPMQQYAPNQAPHANTVPFEPVQNDPCDGFKAVTISNAEFGPFMSTMSDPLGWEISPGDGLYEDFLETAKNSYTNLDIHAFNGWQTWEIAEEMVASGKFEFVERNCVDHNGKPYKYLSPVESKPSIETKPIDVMAAVRSMCK